MKQTNFFKKTLLLVAMMAGVSTAWAIDIPQALGSYISLGTTSGATGDVVTGVNLSNCSVDNSNKRGDDYYTIGSTGSSSSVTFTITANAGNYIFNFKTGAGNCSAELALSLRNSGSTEIWSSTTTVEQTRDSWALGSGHYFKFTIPTDGTYTMRVSVTSKTGNYAGNWGDFAFNSSDAFDGTTWPTSSSMITLSDGIYGGGCSVGNDGSVGNIKEGACAEYIVKNSSAGNYKLHMGIKYYGKGQLMVRVTDILTGTVEAENVYDIPNPGSDYGDFSFPVTSSLTTGVKQLRLAFSGTGNNSNYIINYKNVYFDTYTSLATDYDSWPLMTSTPTYLDLSKWTSNSVNPRYQSSDQNLGYIYHGNTCSFLVYNANETAYYNLTAGITTNVSDANIVVTVTDVATGNVEVSSEAFDVATGTSFATQSFKLSGSISSGLKSICFDFTKDDATTTNWLYNIKNITFYKRSLNEGYNYTPVAAENVDVVLTRTITADKWSTICLPFAMTADQVTAAFGSDVKLASITGYNSGNKQITTAEATTITANEPCFIKVSSNFTSATINGVTIVSGTPEKVIDGTFKLVGTYSAGTIASGNYFVFNNQLYKSTGNSHIKPFRAYFTNNVPTGARIMFWDDEDVTAVTEVRSNMDDVKGEYFDLQGRKVTNPTKGLYIVNGKKVILK